MSNRALAWAEQQTTGNPLRKAVLMVLADKADEANSCFPSQDYIARVTEQGVRSVRRHISQLETDGFISRGLRFKDDGSRDSDRYVLPVTMAVSMARPDEPLANATSGQSDQRPERPAARVAAHQTGTQSDEKAPPARVAAGPSGQVTTTKRERKTKDSPSTPGAEKPPTSTNDERFAEFWAVCPRKIGKADAFRKYALAIRRGASSADLLAGMQAYAYSVRDKDPQYIAHPSTWLHQGRWEDESGPQPRAATELRRWPGWEHGAPRPQGWRAS